MRWTSRPAPTKHGIAGNGGRGAGTLTPDVEPTGPLGLAPLPRRFALSPINQRRWQNFKANRRGYWSLWIFLVLFVVTLFAEFIANDKPLYVSYDGKSYFPVFFTYPETDVRRRLRNRGRLSRSLSAEADRRQGRQHDLAADPLFLRHPQSRSADAGAVAADLAAHRSSNANRWCERKGLKSCSDLEYNWLGTDDQGRDVLARADLRLPHLGAVRPRS